MFYNDENNVLKDIKNLEELVIYTKEGSIILGTKENDIKDLIKLVASELLHLDTEAYLISSRHYYTTLIDVVIESLQYIKDRHLSEDITDRLLIVKEAYNKDFDKIDKRFTDLINSYRDNLLCKLSDDKFNNACRNLLSR